MKGSCCLLRLYSSLKERHPSRYFGWLSPYTRNSPPSPSQVTPGTCVYVAAGQKHSLKNHGDEDWAILFFGVATEPEGAGTSKRDGPISANALHAINP